MLIDWLIVNNCRCAVIQWCVSCVLCAMKGFPHSDQTLLLIVAILNAIKYIKWNENETENWNIILYCYIGQTQTYVRCCKQTEGCCASDKLCRLDPTSRCHFSSWQMKRLSSKWEVVSSRLARLTTSLTHQQSPDESDALQCLSQTHFIGHDTAMVARQLFPSNTVPHELHSLGAEEGQKFQTNWTK